MVLYIIAKINFRCFNIIMKINFTNIITFGNKTKKFQSGKNSIEEIYTDNDILQKRLIRDEFNRYIDSKTFDLFGNIIEHQHYDYFGTENEQGVIETFKDKYQEYIRKAYTKIEGGLKHRIDDFQSKTGKSYVNDFVYDMSGKLIKIINNGTTHML